MTALVITQAAVYADGRLAARVLWSGRMMKIESLRGKGLGRLLPAGYHEGRPDDGRGLYDLWTALHPHVPVPSDRIIARDLPVEDCVALLIEGALSGAARLRLPLRELYPGRAALGPALHHGRRHGGHRLGHHRESHAEAAVTAFRRTFARLAWSPRLGGWYMDQRTGEQERTALPVSSLVGQVVSLGDKDGHVYEGATVTAFDEEDGLLILEGGVHGSPRRQDEAAPLDCPVRIWVHDVARGFINEAD